MNEYDRFIGAFEEFRRWEAQEHQDIRAELKGIHHELAKLNSFKFKVIGGVAAAMAAWTLIVKLW